MSIETLQRRWKIFIDTWRNFRNPQTSGLFEPANTRSILRAEIKSAATTADAIHANADMLAADIEANAPTAARAFFEQFGAAPYHSMTGSDRLAITPEGIVHVVVISRSIEPEENMLPVLIRLHPQLQSDAVSTEFDLTKIRTTQPDKYRDVFAQLTDPLKHQKFAIPLVYHDRFACALDGSLALIRAPELEALQAEFRAARELLSVFADFQIMKSPTSPDEAIEKIKGRSFPLDSRQYFGVMSIPNIAEILGRYFYAYSQHNPNDSVVAEDHRVANLLNELGHIVNSIYSGFIQDPQYRGDGYAPDQQFIMLRTRSLSPTRTLEDLQKDPDWPAAKAAYNNLAQLGQQVAPHFLQSFSTHPYTADLDGLAEVIPDMRNCVKLSQRDGKTEKINLPIYPVTPGYSYSPLIPTELSFETKTVSLIGLDKSGKPGILRSKMMPALAQVQFPADQFHRVPSANILNEVYI